MPPHIRAGAARGKMSRDMSRRSPFEQMLPGHEYSPERPCDRIQSDCRTMQQEDDGEKPAARVIPEPVQDASKRSMASTSREPGDKVGKQVGAGHGHGEDRPDPGAAGQH